MQTSPSRRALFEVLGDDALDDLADRPPADPQQSRDRRPRHLLRQPRHDVLEVARVMRARPRPRHRLHPDAAVSAPQPPQPTRSRSGRRRHRGAAGA